MNSALKGCDAMLLMTKHEEYRSVTAESLTSLLRSKIVIDGRDLFDPREFLDRGFIFKGVGKGNINKIRNCPQMGDRFGAIAPQRAGAQRTGTHR
jgi:UDP-N-acetyl-D-mannosaminuronate dehydrogenase